MSKALPAYQHIKQTILQAIHNGEWRTGTAIPTEMQLAERFAVSRMTVNRALKELSAEKILERRQGSGTFVAQQQFNHTFVEVRNIADDIRQMGKSYQAKVIDKKPCNIEQLPKIAQRVFQTEQKLLQLTIIHYANEQPIQYEKRWVDIELAPKFSQQDFSHVNASDYLIKHIPLVKGSYQIQAELPTDEVASMLKMTPLQPALLLSRYTYSNDDRVVTYVQMWHDGSHFQFSGKL